MATTLIGNAIMATLLVNGDASSFDFYWEGRESRVMKEAVLAWVDDQIGPWTSVEVGEIYFGKADYGDPVMAGLPGDVVEYVFHD